jgi:hypothetical protein
MTSCSGPGRSEQFGVGVRMVFAVVYLLLYKPVYLAVPASVPRAGCGCGCRRRWLGLLCTPVTVTVMVMPWGVAERALPG